MAGASEKLQANNVSGTSETWTQCGRRLGKVIGLTVWPGPRKVAGTSEKFSGHNVAGTSEKIDKMLS